jgi:chaperonin cofactor prefoldin
MYKDKKIMPDYKQGKIYTVRCKTDETHAAYAQKAQYQAKVKELAKAIKELAKVDSD